MSQSIPPSRPGVEVASFLSAEQQRFLDDNKVAADLVTQTLNQPRFLTDRVDYRAVARSMYAAGLADHEASQAVGIVRRYWVELARFGGLFGATQSSLPAVDKQLWGYAFDVDSKRGELRFEATLGAVVRAEGPPGSDAPRLDVKHGPDGWTVSTSVPRETQVVPFAQSMELARSLIRNLAPRREQSSSCFRAFEESIDAILAMSPRPVLDADLQHADRWLRRFLERPKDYHYSVEFSAEKQSLVLKHSRGQDRAYEWRLEPEEAGWRVTMLAPGDTAGSVGLSREQGFVLARLLESVKHLDGNGEFESARRALLTR